MNTKFIIYNALGQILRTGEVPEDWLDKQVKEGEFLLVGEACCVKDSINPETKEIIHNGRPLNAPIELPTSKPAVSTEMQLDLLWQAMDAGTYPKAEPFYSAIKATKEQ